MLKYHVHLHKLFPQSMCTKCTQIAENIAKNSYSSWSAIQKTCDTLFFHYFHGHQFNYVDIWIFFIKYTENWYSLVLKFIESRIDPSTKSMKIVAPGILSYCIEFLSMWFTLCSFWESKMWKVMDWQLKWQSKLDLS